MTLSSIITLSKRIVCTATVEFTTIQAWMRKMSRFKAAIFTTGKCKHYDYHFYECKCQNNRYFLFGCEIVAKLLRYFLHFQYLSLQTHQYTFSNQSISFILSKSKLIFVQQAQQLINLLYSDDQVQIVGYSIEYECLQSVVSSQIMDNLTIQITPLEVTYQHKDPLPLTCVFKKLVIATNHPLEKYQIKSQPQTSAGKNRFNNGPTFALNKQFELQNTKISLDFIAKKQRGVSCIGSAVLDVATLPVQAQSLLDVNLSNCIFPNGKTKLHVKRKQESVQIRKNSKGKPQVMGILQTESQLKQQLMLNRRTNPNIPTAYEISRKNYVRVMISKKQAQTSCHQNSASKRQRGSISKGSYQKRFHATNSSINSRLKTQTTKLKEQSPMPREKTPQPIKLTNGAKTQRGKQNQQKTKTQKYSIGIGYKNKPKQQQKLQEPQNLFVKPYQSKVQKRANQTKQTIQTNENISSNISYNQLQKQKNNKYMDITQKLELIQNIILGQNQKKYRSQVDSVLGQKQSQKSISQFQYNNKCERDVMHLSYNQLTSKNQDYAGKNSSISNKYSPIQIKTGSPQLDTYRDTKQISIERNNQKESNIVLNKQKNINKNTRQTSPTQKSEIIRPIQHKHGDSMLPSNYNSKMQIQQLQGLNIQLGKENQLLRVKLYDAEQTVKKLMRELSELVMKTAEKDKQLQSAHQKNQKANEQIEIKDQEIINLSKQAQDFKKRINDQKNLLDKMTKQFEDNLDEIVILKDEVETLKKSQISTASSSVRLKDPEQLSKIEKEIEQLKQENIKITKKCVQVESTLKFKQNQIKHLKIQINNVNAEKKQLQEQINVIARGKKEEMARQKSLAHIEQISNSSLAQLTKRENQNLKNEVKILQEKIELFNKMLESVINKGGANKQILKTIQLPNNDKQRMVSKIKELQEKVALLQDELRNKKNQFAQIVNIVFSFGDPELMESVENKLMQL